MPTKSPSIICSVAVLALGALAACGPNAQQPGQQGPTPGTPHNLTAAELRVVQRDLRAALIDPESARFGDTFASRSAEGVVTVCGYVNSRNRFGGYAGMSPFAGVLIANGTRFAVVGVAGGDTERQATLTTCRRAGVPI